MNLTLGNWLSDMHVRAALDSEQHARLLHSIENRSLSGFERDPILKALVTDLGRVRTEDSAAALEAFLVDSSLLLDLPEAQVTPQVLQVADIVLIAYEWLM